MHKSLTFSAITAAFTALAGISTPTLAADYYAGKTIEFIVGADVGGGFDSYARTIAKHLPKYIPGSPTIIVKNLPGVGSGKAAAFIANSAPKDGTAIGALMPGAVISPLLEDGPKPQYDPTKLVYLATAESSTRVCTTYGQSKIKTFEQAQTQKGVVGASAIGGSSRDYANLARRAAGAQFEIITGYKGSADMMLAIERGEVDGMCGWDWSSLKAQKPDWIAEKKVNLLMQFGLEPDAELTKLGVPQIWQFVKSDADKKALELVLSQQVFGRPYIAPPGTPAEQVTLLRDGFAATMKDKDFLADAATAKLDINPLGGAKVQEVVTKIYAAPPAVIARAKELIKE